MPQHPARALHTAMGLGPRVGSLRPLAARTSLAALSRGEQVLETPLTGGFWPRVPRLSPVGPPPPTCWPPDVYHRLLLNAMHQSFETSGKVAKW